MNQRRNDMTHRIGLRVVAVLLPAAALLVPAQVHAERVTTADAVGDVMSGSSDPYFLQGEATVPTPDDAATDVTSTSVDHRRGRLVVTSSFRDLRRSFVTSVFMRIRTQRTTWNVMVERRGRQTAAYLYGRRSDERCRGLRTTFDAAADTIEVKVPTSCIDDPRWVQVAFAVARGEVRHDPESGDEVVAFIDDAYAVGFSQGEPAFGPRVGRG